MVHDELTGFALGVEVHDDEVVDLHSRRVECLAAADARPVVLQEQVAAHAVEPEVLERVQGPREAQHLADLLCATQFAVEHRALQDDVLGEVVQPMRVVGQVRRLILQLATGAELKLEPWDGDIFTARLAPTGRFAPVAENCGPLPLGFVQFPDGQGR